jgi:transposase
MKRIGEEVSRELERVEVTVVREVARAKYACAACRESVVTAPAPARAIDKGLLGVGFLAHVISERFGNHMPYHRLEAKYADEGLSLSRSVLCSSAGRCADLLEPIVGQMKREMLAGPFIGVDDTPVWIQERSDGENGKAYVWDYRDHEGRNVYDFTEKRSRDGPERFLEGFAGLVQADAAPLYDRLFAPGGAREVGCMAHARRKFVDAESSDPTLAKEAIERFRAIYDVEREAADFSAAARATLRQEKAAPALAALFSWMEAARSLVLDKSPTGEAIDYSLKNRDALSRYVEDGCVPIDNNAVERGLRRVAVGRKNWNHIGTEEGGRRAAVLFSLVQTCREIGVNPREYFQDVLLRIATCSDPAKLTPHGWKTHFMAEVHAQRDRALARVVAAPR